MNDASPSIEDIGRNFFAATADQFPIASASDEFFYFPQVKSHARDWSRWDAFSERAVTDFADKLVRYENALHTHKCRHEDVLQQDLQKQIDLSFLMGAVTTLKEQLTEVRSWERQPTFHLTIACLGIAEALESNDLSAGVKRAKSLPDFIDSAMSSLKQMPTLFRDLGLTMLTETKRYFRSLVARLPEMEASLPKLDAFGAFLRRAETRANFRMPEDLVEKIIRCHLNCRRDIESIHSVLDREIQDMQALLDRLAAACSADASWQAVIDRTPLPAMPAAGLVELYRRQVRRLAEHCLSSGFISQEDLNKCPVRVLPVPSFLSATRTASSYSIQPDYPPSGGIFYVINADQPGEAHKAYQREFRILSAHETYPGHHLLDSVRLGLDNPIRRCIEKPIFYEGWACFGEKLLQLTGFFDNAADHLLLARRRFWRAVRGKVDLGLQTGDMSFAAAVEYLMKTGINQTDAAAVVRKYPLNPGYQLCYTLGFKYFESLFQTFDRQDLKGFVKDVVSQGEIDFEDLERILTIKGGFIASE